MPNQERERINKSCIDAWGIPQANVDLACQNDWKTILKEVGFEVEYWSVHNAKSSVMKPTLREYSLRLRDKFKQYTSIFNIKNKQEARTLIELPKELFLENKPYLDRFIMTANHLA